MRVTDLHKYLTPACVSAVDKNTHAHDNAALKKELEASFVKNNQEKFREIFTAIDVGDPKLSHRLAHTHKTNAGLTGRGSLQNAAGVIKWMI